jgi:hypothetical protein
MNWPSSSARRAGSASRREVQPVIDRNCVSCHDGTHDLTAEGRDKRGRYRVPDRIVGTGPHTGKKFAEVGIPDFSEPRKTHTALHPYVRRNGPEGDYHLLTPLEFHADTSELVQMLAKGHHNVQLDDEAWARLITWMDLNAPYHGTWTEAGANQQILDRRKELRLKYDGVAYDPEKSSIRTPRPNRASSPNRSSRRSLNVSRPWFNPATVNRSKSIWATAR